MKIEEAFGEVLKRERSKLGVSQDQLAREALLDRTFISLLERGMRQPSLRSMFRIAAALDINPEELVKKTKEYLDENSSD